jgi:hypothetical protein
MTATKEIQETFCEAHPILLKTPTQHFEMKKNVGRFCPMPPGLE